MKMTDVNEVKNVERSDSHKDSVSKTAQQELESLIALKKADLVDEYPWETVLKDNIQKQMASIFATITPEKVKELYATVKNPQERAALELLFKEYEEKDKNEKEKKKEINAIIDQTKLELHYFQEDVVMENASYSTKRLIDQTTEEYKLPEKELKIFDRMLAGKGVLDGKLTNQEQSMRRDFRKAFLESGMDIRGFFYGFNTLAKSGVAVEKDWKNVFPPRERSKGWSKSQQKKFQNGYFAYLEAKKGSPQLSRWTQIITSIETGLLNEGKKITEVYKQSLNLPIAKKAWKQALRSEEAAWRSDYEKNHQEQLEQARAHWIKRYTEQGYPASEAENYAEEVIEKDLQKKWNQYLKELQDTGIQKADLGKFAYVLEAIKNKPLQRKITTLLTDTNFDGMGTHLDGVGVKGGLQLEDTLHEVLNGKAPLKLEQVVQNIAAFTKERMNIGEELSSKATPEEFYKWMAADIKHARAVQTALMDSPMDMKDILRHGTDAFRETMKSYALTPEQLQLLQTKVDTDPETKDLSAADKQLVMSTTSAYLLAKMKEAGPQAGINGLGVGVNIPFEKYLEGLSFTLGTGLTNEGASYLAVGLAWNRKVTEWNIKGNKWSLSAGLNAWTVLWVIPIYGGNIQAEQQINAAEIKGSIGVRAKKSISFWTNVTMLGPIPSLGLGGHYEVDKLAGIEQKYKELKASTEMFFKVLLTGLKNSGDQFNQLKGFLAREYPNSKPEELQKAAENISTVIALAKGINSDVAAQLIAEWYVDSWRNNAIRGLNKNFKISGGGLGIQFLGGFCPVVTLSAKFTKYHNEGIGDAASSKAHQRQSVEYGVGNTNAETLKASDFVLITKQLQTAGILNENEKLELLKQDGDEFVQLPRTLLQKSGLKIAVHERLKGYIATDKEAKHLFLPKETAYRFLEAKMRTGKSYLLNIGGVDNQDGKMTTLTEANLESFLGDKELKIDIMAQSAQTMLEKIREQDPAFKDLKLKVGKNGEMTFSNGEAQLELSFKGNGLWIQDGGKFKLTKNADWTLHLEKTEDTSRKGLEFSFDEEQTQNFEIKHQKSALLQSLSDPKSELVVALSKLDDQHLTALNSFLQNTKATENDYAQASREFLAILPDQELFKDLRRFLSLSTWFVDKSKQMTKWMRKRPNKLNLLEDNTANPLEWTQLLETINQNPSEKYLILDRLKAIFATERKITDLRSLQNIVAMRNNAYQKLTGPNGKTLAELGITIDSMQFAKQLQNIDPQLDPQLVGFTAFYRKGTQEGRGMSLTALGETKVLGGKVQSLTEVQQQAARERFFGKEGEDHASGNLEKYPVQLQFLRDQVKKMAEQEAALTNAQVDDLLKWKSVDIWEKILTLDSEMVFYLLAECANESLGLKIKELKVTHKWETKALSEGTMTWNASEGKGAAHIEKQDFTAGVSFLVGKKQDKPEDNTTTTPGKKEENIDGKADTKPDKKDEWNHDGSDKTPDTAWKGTDNAWKEEGHGQHNGNDSQQPSTAKPGKQTVDWEEQGRDS